MKVKVNQNEFPVSHFTKFMGKSVPVPVGFSIVPNEQAKPDGTFYRWNRVYGYWCSWVYKVDDRPFIKKNDCPCGKHLIQNNDIYSSHRDYLKDKGVEK